MIQQVPFACCPIGCSRQSNWLTKCEDGFVSPLKSFATLQEAIRSTSVTMRSRQTVGDAANILRGTFRLSIVAVIAISTFTAWQEFQNSADERQRHACLIATLRCDARLPAETIRKNLNEVGNVNLGKLGCADRQFWASQAEISDAWSGTTDETPATVNRFSWGRIGEAAVLAFILTNALGPAAIACLKIYRWVALGFAPKD